MMHMAETDWALAYTELVAQYLYDLFQAKLQEAVAGSPVSLPSPSTKLSIWVVIECMEISEVLVTAYLNPISVDWDADMYADQIGPKPTGKGAKLEERLKKNFPPQFPSRLVSSPTIVVDKHRRVLAWLLPGVLSKKRQAAFEHATTMLAEAFGKGSPGWRADPELFKEVGAQPKFAPGIATLSAGWFQQGHKGKSFPIEASASLRRFSGCSGAWMAAIAESNAVVSAMLRVMQPDLYHAGMRCLRQLREEPQLREYVNRWTCVTTAVQIIANRKTPLHRDRAGRAAWMDILVTVGDYSGLRLKLPTLGMEVEYDPGSVVAICGMMLSHSVPPASGERACYAYFMSSEIFTCKDIEFPHWAKLSNP
ncbi:hypothetical protein A0H81_02872 [Grifola frondosa]|uniref:2OGFeDO JBP1/TET oxygenase domain-containing protein n=1 Tax=Grifola frondosa TaxID=5627 RepID=A0A1C7MLR2_GRIFR|nr:hypothetical protein A0H81_02872 [Grifola frondosa]